MAFLEHDFTAGKGFAFPKTQHEKAAVVLAKNHRLRQLPADDQAQDTALVVESVENRQDGGRKFVVQLRYGRGGSVSTPYEQGSALLDPPSFWEVLHCLIMDISNIEDHTFESWCADYGFDSDSRSAEKTFNACRDTLPLVRRLLGQGFDEVRALDEDDLRGRFQDIPTFTAIDR